MKIQICWWPKPCRDMLWQYLLKMSDNVEVKRFDSDQRWIHAFSSHDLLWQLRLMPKYWVTFAKWPAVSLSLLVSHNAWSWHPQPNDWLACSFLVDWCDVINKLNQAARLCPPQPPGLSSCRNAGINSSSDSSGAIAARVTPGSNLGKSLDENSSSVSFKVPSVYCHIWNCPNLHLVTRFELLRPWQIKWASADKTLTPPWLKCDSPRSVLQTNHHRHQLSWNKSLKTGMTRQKWVINMNAIWQLKTLQQDATPVHLLLWESFDLDGRCSIVIITCHCLSQLGPAAPCAREESRFFAADGGHGPTS